METKICGTCKKELPKTDQYFFKRKIKQILKSGELVEYNSYKSDCKKCHANKMREAQRKRRYKELGCSEKDYKYAYRKQMALSKTRHPETLHLPPDVRKTINRWIDAGYKFTTYEQYKLDVRKKYSKIRRKHDYGNVDFVSNDMQNSLSIKNIAKSRVALILGIPTEDLPNEVYEAKKLNILIKRELGLTHSTKKKTNINPKI